MKRRLRKKKHLNEFQVFGAPIAIQLKQGTELDPFMDALIDEAVEANDCFCYIGGSCDRVEGFIELGTSGNDPQDSLERIAQWISGHESVEKQFTGQVIDVYYGDYSELDQIADKL